MKIIEKKYEIRSIEGNTQFYTKKCALNYFNKLLQTIKNKYDIKIIHIQKNNYCIYESHNKRFSIEFISYK